MKKLVYSVFVVLIMTACNSGGGGPSVPAKSLEEQLQEAKSATDFSESILPDSFTVIKANLTYEEQKERYAMGCKTPGQPSWNGTQLDPNLIVGHTFKSVEGYSSLLEVDSKQTVERIVAGLNGSTIVTDMNFFEMTFTDPAFTSIDQIFVGKPHIKTTVTYKTVADGQPDIEYSMVPNLTPAAREFWERESAANNKYLSCVVKSDIGNSYADSADKISYQLDGHSVTGFLVRSTYTGQIECSQQSSGSANDQAPKVAMGSGRLERMVIYSNDLIYKDLLGCGGVEVFEMSRTVLDNGKIIKSNVTKLLAAPLR